VSGVDLTGKLTGPGGVVADGIEVYAYTVGDDEPYWEGNAVTDRNGTYRFRDLPSGTYKLRFWDNSDYDGTYLPFVSEYSGHKQDSDLAATVAVVEDGASRYDMQLQRYGVISGTVSSATGSGPLTHGWVEAYDADENGMDDSVDVRSDGHYEMLVPPGSYKVRFEGESYAGGEWTAFVREYWNNSPTMTAARAVAVGSGQRVGSVDATLTSHLETSVAPRIVGAPVVGRTVTATTGSWNLSAQNTYTYTWLRGTSTVQVGTSPSYVVKAADAGQSLTVRVEASHFNLQSVATSAAVRAQYASVTAVSGSSPRAHVVKLTVTVKVAGLPNPGGTLVVKRGSRLVRTGVAVVNGSATFKVKKQPSGKQRYTVSYSGTVKVLASNSAVTVRVKR
jgi:hypothetical protein